ncbi:MAG TPA: hypothetical protein PK437_12895, partial [Thiobacillaceae bacterium]|nr:hypothetical protein [Thiobacillaceae bacterium]
MTAHFRMFAAVLVAALSVPAVLAAGQPAPVADTRQMVMVEKNARYKVVYDIHSDEQAAGISKGLYYARGLFEAFRKQG